MKKCRIFLHTVKNSFIIFTIRIIQSIIMAIRTQKMIFKKATHMIFPGSGSCDF